MTKDLQVNTRLDPVSGEKVVESVEITETMSEKEFKKHFPREYKRYISVLNPNDPR